MEKFDVKILEVRDRDTFIPVMAIRLGGGSEQEQWLVGRAGFGKSHQQSNYILIHPLNENKCHYDAFMWDRGRTLHEAHIWINEHWEEIAPGDVIDVEFILGETAEKKKSERGEKD